MSPTIIMRCFTHAGPRAEMVERIGPFPLLDLVAPPIGAAIVKLEGADIGRDVPDQRFWRRRYQPRNRSR
jgi:hypothetical protein